MPCSEARSLLRDALALLNDRPDFCCPHDPGFTSYRLAARIEAYLEGPVAHAADPAAARLRCRRSDDGPIRVGQGEREIAGGPGGARLRVPANDARPDEDPDPPIPPGSVAMAGPPDYRFIRPTTKQMHLSPPDMDVRRAVIYR